MRKVSKVSNLTEMNLDSKVVSTIEEKLSILDENYGVERDIYTDLEGYVLVAQNIVDIKILKQDKLNGLVPEYTDVIECSEGVNWTSSLFFTF
ncbi:hypothetical protein [Clostridium sp. NSJ-49]|uniref:hypothetical protein n=1 Tax=Clostridium sp. NSJ-49 TaxID=2763034 RepID=UPI00325FC940